MNSQAHQGGPEKETIVIHNEKLTTPDGMPTADRAHGDAPPSAATADREKKHSRLGRASFWAFLGGDLIITIGMIRYSMSNRGEGVWAEFLVGYVLNVAALGLGIAGLRQKGHKKVFATLGTTFSILVVLATMVLLVPAAIVLVILGLVCLGMGMLGLRQTDELLKGGLIDTAQAWNRNVRLVPMNALSILILLAPVAVLPVAIVYRPDQERRYGTVVNVKHWGKVIVRGSRIETVGIVGQSRAY